MSDFRALLDVSLRLRQVLFDGLTGDSEVSRNFDTVQSISLASPADLAESDGGAQATPQLSLYLYQVLPDPHLRNRPLLPGRPGEQHYPPISLALYYLLTPIGISAEDNLVILGRAMQILAANPIVRANFLESRIQPGQPEVRILLNPVTLEELTRIWNAFNQPYRLSTCYQVQVVSIDSVRAPEEGPPVVERVLDLHQVVGAPAGTTGRAP